MIPHIKTSDVVTYVDIDDTPKQFSTTHKHFAELMEIINGPISEKAYSALDNILQPSKMFEETITDGVVTLELSGGKLVCKVEGEQYTLNQTLENAALNMMHENSDMSAMLKFIKKLSENPDKGIVQQLWDFISVCGLCLTPEGNFLAYKNVNSNFTSIYDNKTDNSPGTIVKMIRTNVDADPDRTCSRGLHFAAWGYLRHYSSGGKTVICSISPADVVSIPSDYNNQKGRACKYKILREVRQPEELKNINVFDEDFDYEEDHF